MTVSHGGGPDTPAHTDGLTIDVGLGPNVVAIAAPAFPSAAEIAAVEQQLQDIIDNGTYEWLGALPPGARRTLLGIAFHDVVELATLESRIRIYATAHQEANPSWTDQRISSIKFDTFKAAARDLKQSLKDQQTRINQRARARGEPEQTAPQAPVEDMDSTEALEWFNQRFCTVNDNGRSKVFEMASSGELGITYDFQNFKNLYNNKSVFDGGESIRAADWWLVHPRRRQYLGGVVFAPKQDVAEGVLNLWRGWGVSFEGLTPTGLVTGAARPEGDWGLLRQHVLTEICAGRRDLFDYMLNWLARCVQDPHLPAETAIVLQGGQGSGKGILGNALLKLFGEHGKHVTQAGQLFGNFNAILQKACFIFSDEAFFAGDPKHRGPMKALITEPTVVIERKGHDPFSQANMMHLLIASNEAWVVSLSSDSRRVAVYKTKDTWVRGQGKSEDEIFDYFKAIKDELDNGGHETLLYDLLIRDISNFDVRRIPKTEGLAEQRQLSLQGPDAWWMEVLDRGYVYESKLGFTELGQWHEVVSTRLLYAAYCDWFAGNRHGYRMSLPAFGRWIKEYVSTKPVKRSLIAAEGRKPNGEAQLLRLTDLPGYVLGSLKSARVAFLHKRQLEGLDIWSDEDSAASGNSVVSEAAFEEREVETSASVGGDEDDIPF